MTRWTGKNKARVADLRECPYENGVNTENLGRQTSSGGCERRRKNNDMSVRIGSSDTQHTTEELLVVALLRLSF